LDSIFVDFTDTESVKVSGDAIEHLENHIDEAFVFAMLYAIGL
jgi:hypothetical protein